TDISEKIIGQPIGLSLRTIRPSIFQELIGPIETGPDASHSEVPFEILALLHKGLPQSAFPRSLQLGDAILREEFAALAVIFGARLKIGPQLASERRIDLLLLPVIEEREELIILFLTDRIELVVMALGTANG